MNIIAVDTSSSALNIGVLEGQKILGTIQLNGIKNHSIIMLSNVDELLQKVQRTPHKMDRIVVTKGPGSYTGLRIGVTFAKTLAWTLKKELVGVSTLEAMAANVKEDGYIIPILDARRKNVYTGVYQRNGQQLIQVEKDRHVSLEKWCDFLKENGYQEGLFLGETTSFKEELKEAGFAVNPYPEMDLINGATLAFLGSLKEPVTQIEDFVPSYLKLVEAEENWQKSHPGVKEESYVEKF